ncbi:MAG: sulfurtransferase TusA family protein, partial [Oribacterium parvum]|nr:sulfurtransferase TusA family protein [Oribacterium parvum]
MDKNLDCKGLACPLPVVEAKKAMEEMQEGILTVLVDNETAVQNLQRLGQKFQYAVASQKLSEKEFEVRIEVKKQEGTSKEKEASCTVVFSSNKMGEGAEELGHTLIKSFVFALSNVDPLP